MPPFFADAVAVKLTVEPVGRTPGWFAKALTVGSVELSRSMAALASSRPAPQSVRVAQYVPAGWARAELIKIELMESGEMVGCNPANRAATPATCGVAMLVP